MTNVPSPAVCTACGTHIATGLLACPACGWLIHGATLRQFAAEADTHTRTGDPARALELWRTALTLLPPETRQYQAIIAKIEPLSRRAETGELRSAPPIPSAAAAADMATPAATPPAWRETTPPPKKSHRGMITATVVAIGLLLWKLKAVLLVVLTKGKLLLMAMKGWTLLSMLASMGVYWTLFGWKFAVGLVLSIYVHEMGHVFALQRYGIKATAPMFIPGLGAMIRLKQYPTLPREDAIVGLAGPLWGLGAAIAAWLISLATGLVAFAAIAQVGAWINLFNLLPVWQLDGSRGFRALNRWQRLAIAGLFGAAFLWTHDGLLLLLTIVAFGVALVTRPAQKADNDVMAYFAVLIVALSALTRIHVPHNAL